MMTRDLSIDDLLDRLVATYLERVGGNPDAPTEDLLAEVSPDHRPALERCFRMIRAGAGAGSLGVPAVLGPGRVVGEFRIEREIGRGGMAIVYEAYQESLERRVALKFLRPGLAVDARHVDRFRREALSIARLAHPGILEVYSVGEFSGQPYIAMELVEGANLAEVFDRLPDTDAWTAEDLATAAGAPALAAAHTSYATAFAALMERVARAVGVAHELGIVHRDLKPSNILIRPDGQPVVADFGLAKGEDDPALSLTGEPLGTPFYMSPEQAALTANPVDQRSDVYSLGVTLYEGLTGRRPFEGDTLFAVIEAIKNGSPPSPHSLRDGLSRNVDAVVRRAMARDPEERYPGTLELAADLAALVSGQPSRALAREGSGLRWWWTRARQFLYAIFVLQYLDYTSPRKFLGLPLVEIKLGYPGPRRGLRRANAWFAMGEIATGFVTFGSLSFGFFSFGGLAAGGLVFGGLGVGLVSFAGMSMGGIAIGGMALGIAALGGMAVGVWAVGGKAVGRYAHSGAAPNPELFELFKGWVPWL